MRFHALMVVRDAADILPQTLEHLLTWADTIHVLDTGSVDNTWDIVCDASARDKRVVRVGRSEIYFSDGLRAVLFETARRVACDGDWFLRTDDDEFYDILPPVFVRERLARSESAVFNQTFEFRLTTAEAAALGDSESIRRERLRSVAERRRYYNILRYSEPRMFRYRSGMQWHPGNSFPFYAGLPAHSRIPVRHYPHRDPEQLRRRVALRAAMTGTGSIHADPHWAVSSWESFLVAPDAAGLHYWTSGEPLPVVADDSHVGGGWRRVVQKCLYAGPVRLADSFRPQYPAGFAPKLLSADVQSSVREAYERGL